MSDAPPDQQEAGDAPGGPKNPWVGWVTWSILAPVMYVLSSGPVVWLVEKGYIAREWVTIYWPLLYLGDDVWHMVERYAAMWVP